MQLSLSFSLATNSVGLVIGYLSVQQFHPEFRNARKQLLRRSPFLTSGATTESTRRPDVSVVFLDVSSKMGFCMSRPLARRDDCASDTMFLQGTEKAVLGRLSEAKRRRAFSLHSTIYGS